MVTPPNMFVWRCYRSLEKLCVPSPLLPPTPF
jgi:hypothetical protein